MKQLRFKCSGVAMIYTVAAMTALIAFASFAVDWGRIQLVKTELRRAADAGARYAAAAVEDSATTARTFAKTAAAENIADGSPVVVTDADVVTGSWNPTARTFTANGSPRNAVQVTAARTRARGNAVPLTMAKALGYASFDVSAVSIAYSAPSGNGYHIIAIDGINMNGTCRIDGFDSSKGSYASTVTGDVNVASNFNYLNMVGGATINADAFYTKNSAPSGNITGTKTKVDSIGTYPLPTTPAGATNHGNYGGGNLTLNSGNHYFDEFNAGNSTVTINASSGPVRIYCNGNFGFGGNGKFSYVQTPRASNLEIHMVCSAGIDPGKENFYAIINAPQSVLNQNGNSDIFGTVLVQRISMKGGDGIHGDTSLPAVGGTTGSGGIELVR